MLTHEEMEYMAAAINTHGKEHGVPVWGMGLVILGKLQHLAQEQSVEADKALEEDVESEADEE